MDTSKQITKTTSAGDVAVEGLLYGIFAGLAMAAFILVAELAAGNAPLPVLAYFDAANHTSPFIGLFTHIAVSGMYGIVFGFLYLVLTRLFGTRIRPEMWLVLGAVYGVLIFGIAQGILLPRTNSPLRQIPVWVLFAAHLLYGLVLAWLIRRSK